MKKVLTVLLYVVICVGSYSGFDFLLGKFLTHEKFVFSWGSNVIIPATTGLIIGLFAAFGMFDKKKKKDVDGEDGEKK